MLRNHLTAKTALKYVHQNQLSAVELLGDCLERITVREPAIGAWEHFDPSYALKQAERCDAMKAEGKSLEPLHGIPVAIKDIFATADLPTGWGTPIHEGTMLGYDAAVVERLRSAGAVIVGKTVTTEYAIARPGKTRNPHNLDCTPGASSSGSAAAVADYMVPLAIGSQTVGSTLRPAAYCGILGFKPSFGLISRYGMMPSSCELDHVGLFARSIADITLLFTVLAGADKRDPGCYGSVFSGNPDSILPEHRQPPKLALVQGFHWSQIEAEAKDTLMNSVSAFTAAGATVVEINLPPEFDKYLNHVDVLSSVGMAVNHGADYDRHAAQMSPKLRQLIERGRMVSSLAYAAARQVVVDYSITLTKILSEYDAILTPVTTGTAPYGLENTGSPVFCALWTLCGLPAISVPAGKVDGLPLGIQLIGRCTGDLELLAIADWVIDVSNCRRTT